MRAPPSPIAILPAVASGLILLVGLTVLIGWSTGSVWLTAVGPGLVPMNPVTAIAFLFSAVALWCRRHVDAGVWATRVGHVAGVAVLAIGGVRLVGYLTGWDGGLDGLLFGDRLASAAYGPNRMAPNTALAFVLVGCALLSLDVEVRGTRPAESLALVVAVICLLTLTGYGYREESLQRVASYLPMALNTAIAFALLCTGLLAARPAHGMTALLLGPHGSGGMLRRLLPAAIGIPWGLGWLCLWGQRAGWYDTTFGVALFAVSAMVLLATAIWRHARTLERVERALHERTRQLELANDALGSFTYSVSHDLRAPLRAIHGFARILHDEHAAQLDGEGRRVLGIVSDNARAMGRLIDDLLAFSRLGRQELARSWVDVAALADGVVAELRRQEPARDVAVTIEPMPRALADGGMLRQVFANLIGNAWKFTRGRATATIRIGVLPGDGVPTYFVRDDGAGFDMAYADKLFGVFQRLHHAEEFEGTGVGLAIVARVVQRHGGRVWAEGAVDRGAAFYFTLPPEGASEHATEPG